MVKTKTITVTKEETVIEDVVCNSCGKSCNKGEDTPGLDAYGLIEVSVSGGYFSDPLLDCHSYTFSLCETCLDKMFKGFEIPVKIEEEGPW